MSANRLAALGDVLAQNGFDDSVVLVSLESSGPATLTLRHLTPPGDPRRAQIQALVDAFDWTDPTPQQVAKALLVARTPEQMASRAKFFALYQIMVGVCRKINELVADRNAKFPLDPPIAALPMRTWRQVRDQEKIVAENAIDAGNAEP